MSRSTVTAIALMAVSLGAGVCQAQSARDYIAIVGSSTVYPFTTTVAEQFGMKISHSHRRTKRRWNPNVQKVRAVVNGSPRRLHVCTSCLKAGKVQKP